MIELLDTEAIQRTLFLDLPLNLVLNVKRYQMKGPFMEKDHQPIKIKQELYLDECSLHRVLQTDVS